MFRAQSKSDAPHVQSACTIRGKTVTVRGLPLSLKMTATENGSNAIAKNQSPTTFAKRQREFNKKAKANDKLAKRADRKALSDASRITRNLAGK